MTLAEIYNAIMAMDVSLKRIESNQINEFERVKARVRTLDDEVEELKTAHETADDDCKSQLAELRRKYHGLNNKLTPIIVRLEILEQRGEEPKGDG